MIKLSKDDLIIISKLKPYFDYTNELFVTNLGKEVYISIKNYTIVIEIKLKAKGRVLAQPYTVGISSTFCDLCSSIKDDSEMYITKSEITLKHKLGENIFKKLSRPEVLKFYEHEENDEIIGVYESGVKDVLYGMNGEVVQANDGFIYSGDHTFMSVRKISGSANFSLLNKDLVNISKLHNGVVTLIRGDNRLISISDNITVIQSLLHRDFILKRGKLCELYELKEDCISVEAGDLSKFVNVIASTRKDVVILNQKSVKYTELCIDKDKLVYHSSDSMLSVPIKNDNKTGVIILNQDDLSLVSSFFNSGDVKIDVYPTYVKFQNVQGITKILSTFVEL